MKFLAVLVQKFKFHTAVLNFLRVGHTHEDIDQMFAVLLSLVLRRIKFQRPCELCDAIRAAMGSPLTFSFLEIPEDLVCGQVIRGLSGDVPDFYYSCLLPADMSPYFGYPDITWEELRDERRRELRRQPNEAVAPHGPSGAAV